MPCQVTWSSHVLVWSCQVVSYMVSYAVPSPIAMFHARIRPILCHAKPGYERLCYDMTPTSHSCIMLLWHVFLYRVLYGVSYLVRFVSYLLYRAMLCGILVLLVLHCTNELNHKNDTKLKPFNTSTLIIISYRKTNGEYIIILRTMEWVCVCVWVRACILGVKTKPWFRPLENTHVYILRRRKT